MTARLAVALGLALGGPVVVVGALELAGGSDRPLPEYGVPDGGCVIDPIEGVGVPAFVVCPEVFPAELEGEYRAAWVGLGLGVTGAILLLALLGRRSAARRSAYGTLGLVSGIVLLAAAWIGLSSIEFDLIGGSRPRPRDPFESVGLALLPLGVVLLPAGALVRRVRA